MVLAAVGQLCSTASMSHNLQQCQTLIQKAVVSGVQALFLPEASDYIAGSAAETVSLAKSVDDSEFVRGLRAEARKSRLAINVGIHEPTTEGHKVKNTLIWIDEQGHIAQRYQKIHLFDVDIHNGPVLKESNSVEKGMQILPPFDTALGRVGMTICFDLRFAEIGLALKRQNAQIITYPSAFTVPTGRAHWEILLRARAIETQAYVIAAAQVGAHNEKRRSYGHSMIVNPWGEILAELGGEDHGPEIATADIDLSLSQKVRREMPLLRRTHVIGAEAIHQKVKVKIQKRALRHSPPTFNALAAPSLSLPLGPRGRTVAKMSYIAANLTDMIDFSQRSLRQYHHKILTNACGGNRYMGCYILAATIFSLGIFRDLLFERALRHQPTLPLLQSIPVEITAYTLLVAGNTLVLSSMWALGLTGTYLGDYFGILMESRVTSFPFNLTDAPMYYGSTMSFLGTALLYAKPAGILLTAEVLAVYVIALGFEDPFTASIYAKREQERQQHGQGQGQQKKEGEGKKQK
ncbi:MAG: Carbon-nitrogen hydrolase [Thelocarpon superellum]|nr:MAG: Carbon-nitrogen hydrolase [Thelocarpon superellum]